MLKELLFFIFFGFLIVKCEAKDYPENGRWTFTDLKHSETGSLINGFEAKYVSKNNQNSFKNQQPRSLGTIDTQYKFGKLLSKRSPLTINYDEDLERYENYRKDFLKMYEGYKEDIIKASKIKSEAAIEIAKKFIDKLEEKKVLYKNLELDV
ncbi:hypothetical protein AYI68_g1134 [Smittium mucronatum]|uniref:Uncharacterized protein n=1 Tax=Smittium mucronatum TaxID=133383 RepID=A0A1R0H6F0_9FUNG|nr:hypothetical protein AYI68_g1134 [Smittium mucronatum]